MIYEVRAGQVAKVWDKGVQVGTQIGEYQAGERVQVVNRVGSALEVRGKWNGWTKDIWWTKVGESTPQDPAPQEPPAVGKVPFTLNVTGYKPYSGELEKA